MERYCASRAVARPHFLASPRPSKANSPEIAENQPELLARHCTEAGLIEQAASLWGKAGTAVAAGTLAVLVEAVAQSLKRAGGTTSATLPASPALRREEMKLQVALITPLTHVKGYAAPETNAAVERARQLIEQAETLGEPPDDALLLFSVLYSFWVANYVAFDGGMMRELSTEFLALAEKQRATMPLSVGHRLVGTSLACTGDIAQGRAHLDRAAALYNPTEHRPLLQRFGKHVARELVSNRALARWDAWEAFPQRRLQMHQRPMHAQSAEEAATGYAIRRVHIQLFRGNYQAVNTLGEEVVALAQKRSAVEGERGHIPGLRIGLDRKLLQAVPSAITSSVSAYGVQREQQRGCHCIGCI